MTDHRSPPPAPEVCLCRPYPSSQKGGTLIADDVHDLAAHERRLEAPAAYRPARCPRCGEALHVHDLRVRVLRGEAYGATEVLRFRCADRARCGAAWQVLPAFLAGTCGGAGRSSRRRARARRAPRSPCGRAAAGARGSPVRRGGWWRCSPPPRTGW